VSHTPRTIALLALAKEEMTMPAMFQGDIFSLFTPDDARTCFVVFGHFGFNPMRETWQRFLDREQKTGLALSPNPFEQYATLQQLSGKGTWVKFIQSHGMSDEEIRQILDDTSKRSAEQGVRTLWTNGISNEIRGRNNEINHEGDDRRAEFIVRIAKEIENESGLSIRLISLNDVFVRNRTFLE
jgi:hypothetical protein